MSNFNLSELFLFPVKDSEARKNFLIASAIYLAAFFIPLLPLIVVTGYTARIIRGVVNGEAPTMPNWDDWESMFKDGAYMFGVRLVFTLPLFVILFPLIFGLVLIPISLNSNGSGDQFPIAIPIVIGIVLLVVFPLSMILGLLIPAAEIHSVVRNNFAAGFRFREWWPIFRSNWTGFLLALLLAYGASMALAAMVGIAVITIVLFCVMPIVMPPISAYLTLIMYAAFAKAYKDGQEQIDSLPASMPVTSPPSDLTKD